MNPSEAKVFSSGVSGVLSSKKRKDFSYSRLGQMDDDSVEFSNIHFQKDRSSCCAKICFGLLALMLLFGSVATAIFLMNLKHFTVDVRLEKGNVRVYKFDQQLTINGNEATTRNMSIVVSMYVINRTENDCWFGMILRLPQDLKANTHFNNFAFLTHVTNTELIDFQEGIQNHFKVFGNRNTDHEISFYVHNILNQLLPIIKVKLYEFVLSKVSSSSRRIAVEKRGFFPGRVHLRQTMMTQRGTVTVTSRANADDFEDFSTSEERKLSSWKLTYDETTVVNKRTGMIKRGDMSISGYLPVGSDSESEHGLARGFAVSFRSIVKLVDKSEAKVNSWESVLKEDRYINHPLPPPNAKDMSLLYFAPPKGNSKKKRTNDIKDLIKLSEDPRGRSIKLPPMITIMRHSVAKSANFDESDGDDNDDDDFMNYNEERDDGDDSDDDDDDDDSENDDDDDNNVPYWPQPNYAPYGIGYEVRRKRSVEVRSPRKTKKTTRNSRPERKMPELDAIWDELSSSSPVSLHEPPRVIRTSIMGFDFRAEIEYWVQANDENDNDNDVDSDNDNDEDWSVTTGYRITFEQYRIAPFRRIHTLSKLRSKLPRQGQRKKSQWTVNAGDFVMCVPLFYIQRLCATVRLTFDMSDTYSLPRLSLSYPVQLTVHLGQTVTTNATLSGHASTWFHESGFYTKGTIAMATLPVRLSFKEDTTPEWCINGNLQQKMVRINTVPLSTWNCSLDSFKITNNCTGIPASNVSLMTFDLQYSSAEGTMFDNWHYPVSCVHRNDFSPY